MDKAKRALFGLSFGHFAIDLYAAILIPLFPFISTRLEIGLGTISAVIAIGYSISSILQPFFGFLSDKMTKRFFMFSGIIFSSLFIPLGFKASNSFLLTLCLLLGIVGNAFYHPQTTTMIKDFYKDNTKLSNAIGIFLGLGTIGYAFGPYISTYVLEKFGENNYPFIALFGILTAFFMLFYVPKIETIHHQNKSNFFSALKDIIKNKSCAFLIVITVIKALLVMSFGTYIPFLLKNHGFSMVETGLFMTAFYIMGGISMIISAKIEKIIKLKGMILASYLPLFPLTIFAVYLLKIMPKFSIVLFLLDGFLILLAAGVVLAKAQSLTLYNPGTISGIIQGFTLAIGSLLLAPLGLLAQNIGIPFVLIFVSFVAFVAALYSLKIKLN